MPELSTAAETCGVNSVAFADLWCIQRHGYTLLGVSMVGIPLPAYVAVGGARAVLQLRCTQFSVFGTGKDYLRKVCHSSSDCARIVL